MEEINNSSNAVYVNETVFDGQAEQGVELSYVLPDYYPDIFKILCCGLSPKITSYSISGDSKLVLDGVVYIRALYLSENSGAVHCVEQRYSYSKTVEFGKKSIPAFGSPMVTLTPKTDYGNCRAVSPRRIDIRGAVSTKIRVNCVSRFELPKLPENLQVKRAETVCCGETLNAEKQFSVREEIETGSSGIEFIISCDAVPKITDVRVIADKAVVKGNVTVSALYGIHNADGSAGCSETEKMSAEIPVSQILDISGITDSHLCIPELNVMNCDIVPKPDSGIVSCELLLQCKVRASVEKTASIPVDVYSTDYETEFSSVHLKIGTQPRPVSSTFQVRTNINAGSGEIGSVWDASGEISNIMCRPNSDTELSLSGQILFKVIGRNSSGTPFYAEKQEAFEQIVPVGEVNNDSIVEYSVSAADTGFSIRPDGTVDITSSVDFSGNINNTVIMNAVNSVTICEDKPKPKDNEYALRIFYTSGAEDCWSIAKRYNTTVEAILRENETEEGSEKVSGMVFIPTV